MPGLRSSGSRGKIGLGTDKGDHGLAVPQGGSLQTTERKYTCVKKAFCRGLEHHIFTYALLLAALYLLSSELNPQLSIMSAQLNIISGPSRVTVASTVPSPGSLPFQI